MGAWPLVLMLVFFAGEARADARVGDLVVSQAWAAPSSVTRRTGSVYLTIANKGRQPDWLVKARSPAAAETELLSHRTGEVVSRARRIVGIALPVGKSVVLKPGSEHIVLIGVETPYKPGARLEVTLVFEKAGELTLDVPVRAGPP